MQDDLTNLIARVEAGTAEQQADLLWKAFEVFFPRPAGAVIPSVWRAWMLRDDRFNAMIAAEAFVDAALMMVPEGMRDEIEITTLYCVARATINMNHGPDSGPFYGTNHCNVISLALAAAILRARRDA